MGALVGVLQGGDLAQLSAPEALYRHPATPGVANFVGDAVFCEGQAAGGRVRCALGDLRLAGGGEGEVSVMVRPEQIKFVEPASGGVAAVIEHVTARVFSHSVPSPGSEVFLTVEGDVAAYPAG